MSRKRLNLISRRLGPALLGLLLGLGGGLSGQTVPPDRDAVTLFVLDFDNIQGDTRLDWLTNALKDMILLRMEEEPRIAGRDAGDITPYLDARIADRAATGQRSLASNTLLLMGAYRREDARLVVDLQLLDMDNWTSLSNESVEALYSNTPQLNELLVERVTDMVRGVEFFSGIDIDAPESEVQPLTATIPAEGVYATPEEYSLQLPQLQEDLARALEDLEEAMDVYSGYRQEPTGTLQSGESYYRDFQLEGSGALPVERVRSTALFEDVLRRVADNPYSAEIRDLNLQVDPYDNNRVYISIPVTYQIKQTLVEDMLYTLPYVSTREVNNLRTITYDQSKFNFSTNLINRIARGDYRIVPVVQLLDPQGTVRAVLVDSPDMSWERYFPTDGIPVARQRRFIPLLAITTSGYSVDVRMETSDAEVFYEFDIDVNQLSSYARVAVQFMKEDQLLAFLTSL